MTWNEWLIVGVIGIFVVLIDYSALVVAKRDDERMERYNRRKGIESHEADD